MTCAPKRSGWNLGFCVGMVVCFASLIKGNQRPRISIYTPREIGQYNLALLFGKYEVPGVKQPLAFDISSDHRRLATAVWIKSGSEECVPNPNCDGWYLGLVDLGSGSLIAHTNEKGASFVFFSPSKPEIVTTLGQDIAILDSHNLRVIRRFNQEAESTTNGLYTSRLISASLSPDGSMLGIVSYDRMEHQQALAERNLAPGQTRFQMYDLDRSIVVTHCTLDERGDPPPSFSSAIAPGSGSFAYSLPTRFEGDNRLSEYDSRSCAIVRSWKFEDPPTRAEFSPDGKYLAVVLSGPKTKVAVIQRSDNRRLWSIAAESRNNMEWPLSISPDSKFLAISTDRYDESFSDSLREMSHITDPGFAIYELSSGDQRAHTQFAKRTPSSIQVMIGTRALQFVSSGSILALAPDSTLRLYQMSSD